MYFKGLCEQAMGRLGRSVRTYTAVLRQQPSGPLAFFSREVALYWHRRLDMVCVLSCWWAQVMLARDRSREVQNKIAW